MKLVGDEKQSGAGERAGNAVRAAACASLTPCASRARDGVIGERAFAKSRKGDERSEACVFIRGERGKRGVERSALRTRTAGETSERKDARDANAIEQTPWRLTTRERAGEGCPVREGEVIMIPAPKKKEAGENKQAVFFFKGTPHLPCWRRWRWSLKASPA